MRALLDTRLADGAIGMSSGLFYPPAAAALAALRRAQPNISRAWIAQNMPIRRDEDRMHYLEGFRRAGLN